MTIFRKFLMGQCSKIVHNSEPYKSQGSSTKMIFDDMYLFLKEAFLKSTGNRHLDEKNGMPVTENYASIAADYWNNIYKDTKKEHKMVKTLGAFFKSQILTEIGSQDSTLTLDPMGHKTLGPIKNKNNIRVKSKSIAGRVHLNIKHSPR